MNLKQENGFTLIEVVASIVIITIVLLSFAQIFIQTNKTANLNNEKLVVVNLAHAELERFKLDAFEKDNTPEIGKLPLPTANSTNYQKSTSKTTTLNDRDYTIKIDAKQNSAEKTLKIVNVNITAISANGKTKSSVEGYVEYE